MALGRWASYSCTDQDGQFLALQVHTAANLGACQSTVSTCVPTTLHATLLAGRYAAPETWCAVDAMFTNTAPVDAYRGAGRLEATGVVRRVVETTAREWGLDPAERRRRNVITRFPQATPVGLTCDTGDYDATMARAIELADVADFEARQAAHAAKGLKRGLGFSAYIEVCGIAPSAVAGALGARALAVRGRQGAAAPHRQGNGVHRIAQPRPGPREHLRARAADKLGSPMDDTSIDHGATAKVVFGMGTCGRRPLRVGGSAIVKAVDKIIAKGRTIAAHLPEAADTDTDTDTDTVFKAGEFTVAGTAKKVPFATVLRTACMPHRFAHDKLASGLDENAFCDPSNFAYPAGTYGCKVEIDPPPATRGLTA